MVQPLPDMLCAADAYATSYTYIRVVQAGAPGPIGGNDLHFFATDFDFGCPCHSFRASCHRQA